MPTGSLRSMVYLLSFLTTVASSLCWSVLDPSVSPQSESHQPLVLNTYSVKLCSDFVFTWDSLWAPYDLSDALQAESP